MLPKIPKEKQATTFQPNFGWFGRFFQSVAGYLSWRTVYADAQRRAQVRGRCVMSPIMWPFVLLIGTVLGFLACALIVWRFSKVAQDVAVISDFQALQAKCDAFEVEALNANTELARLRAEIEKPVVEVVAVEVPI